MTARRRRLNIKPRFYILLAGALCLVMAIMLMLGGMTLAQQQGELDELTECRGVMRQKVADLKKQISFSETDEYAIRQARAMGMIFPGETRYTRVTEDG